ncbi:hypothetical protein FR943_23465 [Mycobacterium sp. TNTM28]|uniref:Uncharacterized protein n=1 Tax=[Mycobacterium] fortunisiensis TaxID=2600579 RepID=A0ABS6KT78_9MYCO|nr:hypothetical protein [[Mycobacterium] fortunisiensis]
MKAYIRFQRSSPPECRGASGATGTGPGAGWLGAGAAGGAAAAGGADEAGGAECGADDAAPSVRLFSWDSR